MRFVVRWCLNSVLLGYLGGGGMEMITKIIFRKIKITRASVMKKQNWVLSCFLLPLIAQGGPQLETCSFDGVHKKKAQCQLGL